MEIDVRAGGQQDLTSPGPVGSGFTDGWRPLLDAIPAAVLIVGQGGAIHFANRQLEQLAGYRRGELNGRSVEVLVPESLRAAHQSARQAYEETAVPRHMGRGLVITCQRGDGSTFPADVSLSPLRIGARAYVVATVSDETERLRTEEDLFQRAVHDALTGLANRVLLLDRLGQALARADRRSRRLAVLYVDLDGFKVVNDTWGHTVGDAVLKAIGGRLAAVVRPEDTVARFGGDEFVVMCEGFTGIAQARELAERILVAVGQPVPHRDGVAQVGASIGVVLAEGHLGAADLIEDADRAMYRAKRRGGAAIEIS
jgi:diguanylate cyclase (GGDEF)-like protein/PAS domain S-box-containing protein